ncbi:hypothetical protein [Aliikangiella coralliicola]|uniref:Uncharacterized protein n=1 Tax=Aliikangiella coralliicola TaxID=2592383 RepID=A0A545UEV4_9GAMM|nr:hypothetical protein [Aliikangiella coralliicola]TQV88011.1 hypothetical protein FLL46_09370 [Aliikangiella coralliicola]
MKIRNRAWRRYQRDVKVNVRDSRVHENVYTDQPLVSGKLSKTKDVPEYRLSEFKCSEKNWKLVYSRRYKLIRAKQLGREYPPKTIRQVLDIEIPIDDDESCIEECQ